MDATLLQLGDIGIRGDVQRLAFRDLTLDAGNDGLFDMRSGALVLDLERVRIVRFDAAHGGCHVFDARGVLIRARDSKIIGGYGRHPGHGDLFRSGPILARFSRCRFELLDMSLSRVGSRGRVLFQDCSFHLLEENPMLAATENVQFAGGVFGAIWEPNTPRQEL